MKKIYVQMLNVEYKNKRKKIVIRNGGEKN